MVKKNIDVEDLFSYYGGRKKVITEQRIIKEYGKKLSDPAATKFSMTAYFDDIDMVPTSFNLDTFFKMTFNSEAIREDFSAIKYTAARGTPEPSEEEPEEPENTADDKIDQQIQQSMTGKEIPDADIDQQIQRAVSAKKTDKGVRPTYVDYDAFYWGVYRKKIPPFAIENKIRELTRAGVINLGDFKITIVDDSSDADSARVWDVFRTKDKKNTQATPIVLGYGYTFTFESTNELKKYSEKDCLEVIKEFIGQFQKSILVDTKYYKFSK